MWRNRFSIFISKLHIWYINNRTRDLSLNCIILLIFSHILTSICACFLFLPGSQLSLKHLRHKNRLVPNFQHPVSSEIHTVTFQLLYHTKNSKLNITLYLRYSRTFQNFSIFFSKMFQIILIAQNLLRGNFDLLLGSKNKEFSTFSDPQGFSTFINFL